MSNDNRPAQEPQTGTPFAQKRAPTAKERRIQAKGQEGQARDAQRAAHEEAVEAIRKQRELARAARREEKALRKHTGHRAGILEICITFFVALLVTVMLRMFIVTIVTVDGGSMESTLIQGDRVVVVLYDYWFSQPQRGDIVLCHYPSHNESYIKRVLALPGEMVMLRGGVLYVNGRAIIEDYVSFPAVFDFGPTVVPHNSYFVLGDNRPVSGDSRLASVGAIARENIQGRGVAILQPFSRMGELPTR